MFYSSKGFLVTLLLALALFACTSSDPEDGGGTEVAAGIGNDCGPADAREVWLRVEADSNLTRCPASTLDGLRIRLKEGVPLDSLKTGTYSSLPARDCRDTLIYCPLRNAAIKITEFTPTEVRGSYRLEDSLGTTAWMPFKALRCIVTPHCG
jgi:hypothetical protein